MIRKLSLLLPVTTLCLLCLLPGKGYSDVYDLEAINKLYVTNAPLAHIRIDSLQRRCEENGYKECKQSRLENIYSYIMLYEHEPALAVKHANKALEIATQEKDNKNQLCALQLLIENELNLGFYKVAVNHIQLMMRIARKSPKSRGDYYIPTALKYLAMSCSKNKEIDKSMELLNKAITISKNTRDEYILYYELSFQKAKCYLDVDDYQHAKAVYLEILRHLDLDSKYSRGGIDKAGYDINYLETYSQLALIYAQLNHNDSGYHAYNKVRELYKKYPDVPEVKNRMARFLLLTKQYEELNRFVEPMIDPKVKSKEMLELMQTLQQSYLAQQKNNKAKKIFEEYIALGDSIQQRTSGCALEEMNIAYQTSDLQKKIAIQRAYLVSGIIILILFTIIIVVAIVYNRRLRRMYISAKSRIDEFMEQQNKVENVIKTSLTSSTEEQYKELFWQLDNKVKKGKNYLDATFSRDDLAALAKMDKNKLTDVVKLGANMTPAKYLTQLRLIHSVELLKEKTEYSIDSIAMDSGFGTRTTFYRLFIDKFGITPAQYRKVLKSEQLTDIES